MSSSVLAAAGPTVARVYGLALLVQLIWGLNNVLSKFAIRAMPSLLVAGIRMQLAALLIVPVFLWMRAKRPAWREMLPLIGLGVVGAGLNQVFFTLGIARTSVTHAALIIPLTPLLTLGLSSIVTKERITARKVTGMLIAFAGVLVLQFSKAPQGEATVLGDVLIFCGILSFASYIVFGKKFTARHDGVVVNTVAYVATGILFLPVTMIASQGFAFSSVPAVAWGSLLYMAAGSSIAGYLLYYWVLTHMDASRLSAFSYLQPVLTTSMAALILGEPLTGALFVAGFLVLAGVYVAERTQ